ncbi:hypothetical protein FRB96_001903 [Tulasnella sp. 330]|nr:hypothetical protein FRB96_001903 [Tulasnella sp. 330]
MFGPFLEPLPSGEYIIQRNNDRNGEALNFTGVVNGSMVNLAAFEPQNDRQVWKFEYGDKGYKIKNVTNDTYLSYPPWIIPTRVLKVDEWVVCAADSPVEWSFVQISHQYDQRFFVLGVVNGLNLQPGDDLALDIAASSVYLNHFAATFTSFCIRAIRKTTIPDPRVRCMAPPFPYHFGLALPVNNEQCVIRSVFNPEIALDLFNGGFTTGNLVLGNKANGGPSQTWTMIKGRKGYKLKDLMSSSSLGYATVEGTPDPSKRSVVSQDDHGVEWLSSVSNNAYEIRLVSDPKYAIAIWDCDATNNAWVCFLLSTSDTFN